MRRTYDMARPVYWLNAAAVVGPREGQGPLAAYFDEVLEEDLLGQKSFEAAEMHLQLRAADRVLRKSALATGDVDYLLSGDLLNQVVAAGFAARSLKLPYWGLYGACSTMAESLMLASLVLSGGYGETALCIASSHFSSAERQYRFPLEMGAQRPPSAQWTVTGAGASILSTTRQAPLSIARVTPGRVIDLGVKDANHMGAAMAPAAADTMKAHFEATKTRPSDYDRIVTGDLGTVGSDLLREMLAEDGLDMTGRHLDCGAEIFRGIPSGAGGSGCGCCAVTLSSYVRAMMLEGTWRRVLFAATGALLSPTTTQQGESIPSIAHAVELVRCEG